jgi:DNA polymerase-1
VTPFTRIVLDIETASVADMHRPDRHQGPYVRLFGILCLDTDRHLITDVPKEALAFIRQAELVVAHNGIDFDAQALAAHHGGTRQVDWYRDLCLRMFDTLLTERHLHPVAAKGAQPTGYYGLDQTAKRYGHTGKSDDLKALARKHGGFDLIPTDDEEYRSYLLGDLHANAAVYRAQKPLVDALPERSRRYLAREHRVQAACGVISLNGFRVDTEENERRFQAGQDRLINRVTMMSEKYGMPAVEFQADGRVKGAPHRTNLGKAAFRAALLDTGILEWDLDANWPLNKDGSLNTAKDVLNGMVQNFRTVGNRAAQELCETILAVNGERTVYGTIRDHIGPDGKVHPTITPEQGSGRWSVKDPGLTVLGKRGGKSVERGVLLPDTDDEVLVAFDLDQIDMRMVAALSGDMEYAKLFAPGADAHQMMADIVFGETDDKDERKRRRENVKPCNHGANYGAGVMALVRQGVPEDVARRFLDSMRERFPKRHAWINQCRVDARALGFDEAAPKGDEFTIVSGPFGRPMRVERNRAYTQAPALQGQGGTRDVIAEILLRLPLDLLNRVRAVIHDEIVLSLPRATWEAEAKRVLEVMTMEIRGVPVTAGCSEPGDNWAGCY